MAEPAPPAILATGPPAAPLRLLLAHGAGAPMDSPFMAAMAGLLGAAGIAVLRFEFPYMAARRAGPPRRPPPPRAETLRPFYRDVVSKFATPGTQLAIGGKSMGGRIAAMLAADPEISAEICALVCLGFPFLPPKAPPGRARLMDLKQSRVPALICQGERDPFGNPAQVAGWALPPQVALHWLADGDHDFRPRRASGRTHADNLREAADAVAAFLKAL